MTVIDECSEYLSVCHWQAFDKPLAGHCHWQAIVIGRPLADPQNLDYAEHSPNFVGKAQ
jgi:hypothetical protein